MISDTQPQYPKSLIIELEVGNLLCSYIWKIGSGYDHLRLRLWPSAVAVITICGCGYYHLRLRLLPSVVAVMTICGCGYDHLWLRLLPSAVAVMTICGCGYYHLWLRLLTSAVAVMTICGCGYYHLRLRLWPSAVAVITICGCAYDHLMFLRSKNILIACIQESKLKSTKVLPPNSFSNDTAVRQDRHDDTGDGLVTITIISLVTIIHHSICRVCERDAETRLDAYNLLSLSITRGPRS